MKFKAFILFLLCVTLNVAHAGHLFTQGSTNVPTWMAPATGIAIDQYHLESGAQFDIYFEQPSVVPTVSPAIDTSTSDWWTFSAGDVIKLTFTTSAVANGPTGTTSFSIAFDPTAGGGSCAYDQCGVGSSTGLSSISGSAALRNAASALYLDLPAGTLSSSNSYTWTAINVAGEFALSGFRIGFANGKVHGSQTGPLNQNSVVSVAQLPGGGGAPPPIDTAAVSYTDAQLNSGAVLPKFDGGTLSLGSSGTVTTAFTVTSNGGTIGVGANDVEFSGVISDDSGTSGVLTKSGTGVLTLSAVNTFTGGLAVAAGELRLTGSLANAGVTVSGGATLSGTGTVGGDVALDGDIRPGSSPGSMSVAGDFTMTATSNYIAEVDGRTYSSVGGAGSYDRITLTGASSVFNAGGTLTPVLRGISGSATNSFTPIIGDRFRLVSTVNASGVSGAFASVVTPSVGLSANSRFDTLYGANYIDLVLTPASLDQFAAVYGLQNMVNAAVALDAVRPAAGSNGHGFADQYFHGLYGLNSSELATALLQSAGQIYAISLGGTQSALMNSQSRLIQAAQMGNSSDLLWVDATGYLSRTGKDAFATASSDDGSRFWLGANLYHKQDMLGGIAFGQVQSKVADSVASATARNNMLAAYLFGQRSNFDFDFAISLNSGAQDVARSVALSADSLTANGRQETSGATIQAGLGWTSQLDAHKVIRTYGRLNLGYLSADRFAEAGSSVIALVGQKQKYDVTELAIGTDLMGTLFKDGYAPLDWKVGGGVTLKKRMSDAFVDRTLSMHGATWSVSESSFGHTIPFVNVSVSQKVNEDVSLDLQWSQSRVGGTNNRFWQNTAYLGLNAKW
jgi:autotransporter-associated beta strand protein